ncbi:unnamed protein product [Linum trigynum]|uniref:Uncharacterized protein n=1 Tax=Linum trigynum TaxID=586398 RepID=A0AAV2CLX8_9ROSI
MHGGDVKYLDDVGDDLVAHKMAVKLNVFRPFMEGWIFGDVDCRLVVAIKNCWLGMANFQILEKIEDPLDFAACVSECPIFSFTGRAGDGGLLFSLP